MTGFRLRPTLILLCVAALGASLSISCTPKPIGCIPEVDQAFCGRLGKNCGAVINFDNCGSSRTVTCGACNAPLTCSGAGVADVCGSAAADSGGGADSGSNLDAGGDAGVDSGAVDGGGDSGSGNGDGGPFAYVTLTPTPNDFIPNGMAMAVGPNDSIGVAYFQRTDGGVDASVPLPDGGFTPTFLPSYDVRYVEWSGGTVRASQQVQTVQMTDGIALAFQGNGQPVVAYLGGLNKNGSSYWLQQNATINFRQGDGITWNEELVDDLSANVQPTPPNPVDATGGILGLYPALAVDPSGTVWFAYRDVHDGQFPKQDWAGSDLKIAWGGANNWQKTGIAWGGNDKQAYGGHNQLVMGPGGQPAVVSDQVFGNAFGFGANMLFYQHVSTGAWTPDYRSSLDCVTQLGGCIQQVGDTQYGPSLAWDDPNAGGVGFGIAFIEVGLNKLSYISSATGTNWAPPDPVFQGGTGGWYPALAIDPQTHVPSIAFYVCSNQQTQTCDSSSSVQLAANTGASWSFQTVDTAGAFAPKLGILSSGKRVVAYQVKDGSLRLAVER